MLMNHVDVCAEHLLLLGGVLLVTNMEMLTGNARLVNERGVLDRLGRRIVFTVLFTIFLHIIGALLLNLLLFLDLGSVRFFDNLIIGAFIFNSVTSICNDLGLFLSHKTVVFLPLVGELEQLIDLLILV